MSKEEHEEKKEELEDKENKEEKEDKNKEDIEDKENILDFKDEDDKDEEGKEEDKNKEEKKPEFDTKLSDKTIYYLMGYHSEARQIFHEYFRMKDFKESLKYLAYEAICPSLVKKILKYIDYNINIII
jgi:hypothetical protein